MRISQFQVFIIVSCVILAPAVAFVWTKETAIPWVVDLFTSEKEHEFRWDRSFEELEPRADMNEEMLAILPKIMYSTGIQEYKGVKVRIGMHRPKFDRTGPTYNNSKVMQWAHDTLTGENQGRGEQARWWRVMNEENKPIVAIMRNSNVELPNTDEGAELAAQWFVESWDHRGWQRKSGVLRPEMTVPYVVYVLESPRSRNMYAVRVKAVYDVIMDAPDGWVHKKLEEAGFSKEQIAQLKPAPPEPGISVKLKEIVLEAEPSSSNQVFVRGWWAGVPYFDAKSYQQQYSGRRCPGKTQDWCDLAHYRMQDFSREAVMTTDESWKRHQFVEAD